ncbi:MAG: protease [Flavobacterium sp.]|uniref:FMN-binding negative transcriptional regulator n=1 Tax=Flavobacterium sp. TaxID=239 RepID=UPI0025B958B3|nr:FMN-binding negative transcriptional regulator [Flavobacterium sp.]MBA4134528.1 protease [Flavobacterium sp.]
MYIPELYKNENREEIESFIHQNGFAILVNQTQGKLWATHTPLLLETREDGKLILTGHISKANPQALSFNDNDEVLAIFSGAHTYISSSWYDHENVPTWNYLAVHVYGKVRVYNHEEALDFLKKLVDKYEAKSKNPIRVENLSEKTMREARGIVAFEIEITSIEAQKKLSQNRDDKNYRNIITELEKTKENQALAVAEAMKKNR